MQQSSFNDIQSKFKKYLAKQLHPKSPPKTNKKPINPQVVILEEIERTTVFGSLDAGIGYRKIT